MSNINEERKTNYEKTNCLRCNAYKCIYNDQNCGCNAKEVVVGPDFATSNVDTICGTFKRGEE